ncbi:MAG: phage major capsid protein [Pseudomonadota bacterium]|nr:phage major capsid protein [Pseudomonadota bacterium]
MSDQKLVAEAKSILDGIKTHQNTANEKFSQFEKQLDDLKRAQRLIQEAQATPKAREEHANAPEFLLKNFVNENGVQWSSQKRNVQIAGRGTVTVEEKGLLDTDMPVNQWHADLISINKERSLARLIMSTPNTPKSDLKLWKHLQKAPRFMQPAINKAFTDAVSEGAEWIPDQFAANLYFNIEEQSQIPRVVADNLQKQQVERSTILVPRLERGGRPYLKGSIASDNPASYTASSVKTSQKSITVKGLASRFLIDDAAQEDSAIAVIPALQRQIIMDLNDAMEDALINGDDSGTHQDAIADWNIRSRWGTSPALGGSSDHRRMFKGMRKQAFDRGTTADLSNLDFAKLLGLKAQMGELALQNVVIFASPEAILANLLGLDQVKTIDVFGPQATVVTGQIANIIGMPIIMTRFMGADLNNSGKYDNLTKDKTGLLMAHAPSWYIFERRGILVESDRKIDVGATEVVATMRATFDTLDLDATKNVAFGFKMATS